MTPKEAKQKICPMMSGRNPNDVNRNGVENCWANRCAVWEVNQTIETVYNEEQPDGEGWEKVSSHIIFESQNLTHRWTRPLPIEDQPGQCGLITKWNEGERI